MPALYPAHQWISFLRKYGPVPTNDNMYDEAIQRTLRTTDIQPIQLPSPFLDEIIKELESSKPRSVVLTGTAGDGKTYHCREVFTHFGGDIDEWNEGKPIQRIRLEDYELQIVKDLSEFPDEAGRTFVEYMANELHKNAKERVFLVAANHGQLLEKLNQAEQTKKVTKLKEQIVEAMVTSKNPADAGTALFDLSKASAVSMLEQVASAVIHHPGWDDCESCPSMNQKPICPIHENRRRLAKSDGPLFLERLTDLFMLSQLNKVHYPIRQLLALVSNMLLGHPTATDKLMTCRTAARIVEQNDQERANIYSNVFGENLGRRANRIEPFSKLKRFGIGDETNNSIDNILVYGKDDPELLPLFTELMLSDDLYGATDSYLAAQTAYLEDYTENAKDTFLRQLRTARQRLFFVIDQESQLVPLLWDLTVFRFAGDFLTSANKLRRGQRVSRNTLSRIVRGLNRVFTGMLIDDDQQVVIASAGSHSQSRTSYIVDAFVSVTPRSGEEVGLHWRDGEVMLCIAVALSENGGGEQLPLTLLRFEFLSRVSQGALPSSFSRECLEDFLDFKAKVFRAVQERDGPRGNDEEEIVINFLDIGSDGFARQQPVGVKLQ